MFVDHRTIPLLVTSGVVSGNRPADPSKALKALKMITHSMSGFLTFVQMASLTTE